jgi:hypothetical protein
MIPKRQTFGAVLLMFSVLVNSGATEPEALFQKAAEFYARGYASRPWPGNEPTGLELLMASADASYPPALYNVFLGYKFGILGMADERKATAYRVKWLTALNTPSSHLKIARGVLGSWEDVADPTRSKTPIEESIFTGEIARNERHPPRDLRFVGMQDREGRDERLFVSSLTKAIELAILRQSIGGDRAAAEDAADLLATAVIGTPIQADRGQHVTITRSEIAKGSVLRSVLRGARARLIKREKALLASSRLFDELSEEELRKALSE